MYIVISSAHLLIPTYLQSRFTFTYLPTYVLPISNLPTNCHTHNLYTKYLYTCLCIYKQLPTYYLLNKLQPIHISR